ncbi:MAG TPA: hypothetical protein VN426_04040 [Syntrophomonadaceae bacterium]|nr:hypothetical protein [Syntrophomonadaceae bacterium]
MLEVRQLPFEVPKYSLIGDILSFQRCGLQYRYYSGSSLPPSRPVQLWTGEFTHGVMEEAFLVWNTIGPIFPWPCNITPWPTPNSVAPRIPNDIGVLGDIVEARLLAKGMRPRSSIARNMAYERISKAINLIAPILFPLITSTEERISGTRQMPNLTIPLGQRPRGDRYELTGVADVISSVSITANPTNFIVNMMLEEFPSLNGTFDVIVDYKAARRPPTVSIPGETPYWAYQEWQIQTYSWLRQQQHNSHPVKVGLIIYTNELSPSKDDLSELLSEIRQSRTDVSPIRGSSDYYELFRWAPGARMPIFSGDYLLRRAFRFIDVHQQNINHAVQMIDNVVAQIEGCAVQENCSGTILNQWPTNGGSSDCASCDFRRFCKSTSAPNAPG